VLNPDQDPRPATPDPAEALRVLRVCSVYEVPADVAPRSGFDPVGGMQGHTAELTRHLDRLGVAQTVLTAYRPGAPAMQTEGERSTVHRLGVPIRRFRQLYGLAAALRLARHARGIDVVHVHTGEDLVAIPLGLAAARMSSARLVVTLHCSLRHTVRATNARTSWLHRLGGSIEAAGLARGAAVIVLTTRMADALIASGVEARTIHVVPPGVDVDLLRRPFPRPAPELGPARVVFVGRLVRAKGVHVLLNAFSRLGTDPSLVFVGGGPEESALRRRVAQLGLDDRVRITGFVPAEAVAAHLQHATVMALPSMYEELGRVLLEAHVTGTPIVASDVGGIPEIVRHGRNGLLVRPGDPIDLAAALGFLLRHRDAARAMGAYGEAMSPAQRWSDVAVRVLQVYRHVAPRGPSRRTTGRRDDRAAAASAA
jgi:glycogen(starch) synthase